jgi:hypothetical protein
LPSLKTQMFCIHRILPKSKTSKMLLIIYLLFFLFTPKTTLINTSGESGLVVPLCLAINQKAFEAPIKFYLQ